MVSISHLPEEILERILYYISPYNDYKAAMLVCKSWYRIMKGVMYQKYTNFNEAVNSGQIYWTELTHEAGPTISERYSHSAVYFNKSVYFFGGYTSSGATFNDIWRLDLGSRQWIRPLAMGTYPSPKACATLVPYRDCLILFGGWSHPTPYPLHQVARFFNELHIYKPSSNKWSSIMTRNSTTPVAGHSASIIQDMMIVFGGSHGHGASCNDLWILDLKEQVWSKKDLNPCPSARYGQSQVTLDNNHILMIGGCHGPNSKSNDVWMLIIEDDSSTMTWRELSVDNMENSACHLWAHPACKVGDKVVVLSKLNKFSKDKVNQNIQPQGLVVQRRIWAPPRGFVAHPSEKRQNESRSTTAQANENVTAGKSPLNSVGASLTLNRPGPPGLSPVLPRQGKPAVRPNAMNNRAKQLEILKQYEDMYKEKLAYKQVKKVKVSKESSNAMYLHMLDVSHAISHGVVSWQPITEQQTVGKPPETIFFSLTAGRGELVLFGGIEADINSMQIGSDAIPSNRVHFINSCSV